MYNRTLKIYRGADNRIDFQARNSSEKAIDITGYTPVLTLINDQNQQVLKVDATIQSASSGKAYVILSQSQLRDLDKGFYKYSVVLESRVTSGDNYTVSERKPTYIDSQYGAQALVEIYGDLHGEPTPTATYKNFAKTSPSSVGEPDPAFYTSDLIDADYESAFSNSLHTFGLYMSNYTGNVSIQGSLTEGGVPSVWVELASIDYINQGLTYQNIEGKWKWFKIVHTPSTDNVGRLDKVLYR